MVVKVHCRTVLGDELVNASFHISNRPWIPCDAYMVSTRFHISNRPLPFHLHLHQISKFLDSETLKIFESRAGIDPGVLNL